MARYEIAVKPGSSREQIVPNGEDSFIIYLRAKAHDGEANAALIKLLSKHFDVPKTTITIVKGDKSRHKIVEF